MNHLIACRIASYGKFQERAWSHLPTVGIRYVEMPAPAPNEIQDARRRLADHGLQASSLQGKCQIGKPDAADDLRTQIYACSELGARFLFLSVKKGDTPEKDVWERMREIGDLARAENVTIVMETHPDLVTNGDVGRRTMEAINHPNVRINYDTANVYYYNEGIDSVAELTKLIDYVAAVHLKETNGGFKTWHFPALGQGIVNFPEIFRLLDARGFAGPYTMEIEGIEGVEWDEVAQLRAIEDSVSYLRRIGVMS
ncbi:MAG TPA: sugar phosphate isomerase/epimerase family protein [Phycisphaerae bacterium]|nr:sugar phosphate isomerase/epimerase family protein [Phycisphaerae bacterium]HOJ72327.1 sugar phosphate isomerase/epimerase family protein [Phycisphaerae bacterium]HOM50011.1 sugar phosphate isomerase/epimerase family protein [Phycisphaerae bacterium]HON65344.1 sugar phosphate isomerase/epimerase family protein [Phycisphaerae bacterium]HOQ84741.1 sugar phosphate isomerase/epimerase family protein [Phycisphaerae bacterium]